MLADAIQYIETLARKALSPAEHVVEIYGRQYTSLDLRHVPESLPVQVLRVSTLSALVGYVADDRDRLARDLVTVHVVSPTHVCLLLPLSADMRRSVLVEAKTEDVAGGFLGEWHDPEMFTVGLQTRFDDDEARAALIRLVGNLSEERVATAVDDGNSQNVVVRAGVARVADARFENPIILRPFRSFAEIEPQPQALVIRLRKGGSLPQSTLLEADGGIWRRAVIARMVEWLRAELPAGVSVIG